MLRKTDVFPTTLGRELVCLPVHALLWFSSVLWGLYYNSVQHFHSPWGQSPTCSCRHLISGGTQWPPSSWQVWKFDVVSGTKMILSQNRKLNTIWTDSCVEVSWSSGYSVSKSKDTKKDYGDSVKKRNLWPTNLEKKQLKEGYCKGMRKVNAEWLLFICSTEIGDTG